MTNFRRDSNLKDDVTSVTYRSTVRDLVSRVTTPITQIKYDNLTHISGRSKSIHAAKGDPNAMLN